jgi:hypothetical protein
MEEWPGPPLPGGERETSLGTTTNSPNPHLHLCIPRHHEHVFQHLDYTDQTHPRKPTAPQQHKHPYTVRTLRLVRSYHATKLLQARHNNTQIDGLAMGAPSSSIISEIFLQHSEHTHLPLPTQKHKLINYVCYIDNILIVFDSHLTNLHSILWDFNSLHPNLHFTEEIEQNNSINYLDITTHKTPTNVKITVYRKPTFTDTIIPYTSNHPPQHIYAADSYTTA